MTIVIVAIVVIALIVGALVIARQRRSKQLQDRFGPEYERAVEERGGRREAETELLQRRQRRQQFVIR